MPRGDVSRIVALASLAVACKPKDKVISYDTEVKSAVGHIERRLETPLPAGPSHPSAVREFIITLRRHNFEDCMYLAHIDGARTVVRDAKLLASYKRLCEHDMQLSSLRLLVDAAEAARKAKPDAETLPACEPTDLFIATDDLKRNKTADTESAALEARFTAACAPAPAEGSAATGSAASGSAASGSAASGSAAAGSAAAGSAAAGSAAAGAAAAAGSAGSAGSGS